jgi:hypothetical protein
MTASSHRSPALLAGAAPNRERAARIRAALGRPVVGPDRLAIARLDARLRQLAAEIVAPGPDRSGSEIVAEIEATRRERERLAAAPREVGVIDPEDALEWLGSLGNPWRETSDEGRRQLALGVFERIEAVSGLERGSHRIVGVELTEEAERRGIVLALPASIEVRMVGDTGASPTRVTSWPIEVVRRAEWLAAAERRSA